MPTAPLYGRLSHREILVILCGVLIGMLLAAIDQTIVATALPAMAADLGGAEKMAWVVSAYLVASTAATPIYGKLSDTYGRRALQMTAVALFVAASALCALATTMDQLIAFRALQGLGGGGLLAMAHATIADIITPRERGRYAGYIGGVFAVASVIGPVLGGICVDQLSWRWVFWINLPVGLIGLGIAYHTLRRLPIIGVRHRIDYAGAVLLVAAVVCVLLVTTELGGGQPWRAHPLPELTAAAIAFSALLVWREFTAAEPILPPRLFANTVFSVANLSTFLVAMAVLGSVVLLPIHLQLVVGAKASEAGLQLIPLTLSISASAITSGRLITRTGRYKAFPLIGLTAMVCGFLLLALLGDGVATWVMSLEMALLGAGIGFTMPVVLVAIQNAVAPRDLGTATASVSFFRSLGGSFGVALLTATLIGVLNQRLTGALGLEGADVAVMVLERATEGVAHLPQATQALVLAAAREAFRDIFLLGALISAAAFATILFLEERPLRTTLDAIEVAANESGD